MEAETKNELKMRIRVDGRKKGERNCIREHSNFYSKIRLVGSVSQ